MVTGKALRCSLFHTISTSGPRDLSAMKGLLLLLLCIWTLSLTKAQDYKDALFAALSKNSETSSNPLKFDRIDVDARGSYDKNAGRFYVFKDGDYWAGTSMGAKVGGYASVYVYRDSTPFGRVYKDETMNGEDTAGRDIIITANKTQMIYIESHTALYSDEGLQTSFSLFRLSDLMIQSTWFSVQATDHKGSDSEIVPFPITLVNKGNRFSRSMFFTAEATGLYFVSYSIGTITGQPGATWLIKNGKSLGTLSRYCIKNTWYKTLSRAGMYHLNDGDIVYVTIDKTHQTYGGSRDEKFTTFSGFFYNPSHGIRIAWNVAKTTSWRNDTFTLEPIPFEEILVNEGQGWNKDKHTFITPVSGLYYVTIVVGAQAEKRVDVSILVDRKFKVRLTRYSTVHDNTDMLSRSAILYLKKGSRMRLRAEDDTALYSTEERQTAFSGFLLFPH